MVIDAIKELRQRLGYSQSALAKRLGIALRSAANYESGDREPPADVLQGLATLARKKQLPELERIFQDAFQKEVAGREAPVTSAEKVWVRAVLLLLRSRRGLSADITSRIITELRNLAKVMPADPAVTRTLLDAELFAAGTPKKKINVLVTRYTGTERDEAAHTRAIARIVEERPALFEEFMEEVKEDRNNKAAGMGKKGTK
jgi:transcriptional regulator with XRE-family HTH domain